MKRPAVIGILFAIAVIAFYVYFTNRPPPGVEIKGAAETTAWVSLAISIVSLLTAVVGLTQKILELRLARNPMGEK